VPLWRRDLSDAFTWADAMSVERGWVGEPLPTSEWHSSRYSRMADKIHKAEQQRLRQIERDTPRRPGLSMWQVQPRITKGETLCGSLA
jgi:hypothetical protein